MSPFTLEVCVDSVESALAAQSGGADRLELCGNLIIGGTSPSPGLFQEVRRRCDIRVHILLRPRFGDFLYSEYEYEILKEEVRLFRKLGADGIVIGALHADGGLDVERLAGLKREAGTMWVTLHRAFDVCREPFLAMEQATELGFDTILTSGQKNICTEGMELLKELQEESRGRIQIQAGAGVSVENIEEIYRKTGIRAFHMSGKRRLDSQMKFRREGVSMGLPGFSEYEKYQTDEEAIRAARKVLENL